MSPTYGVSGTQRTVNTEKFFKERALKISTGKAGKDFAFSDDDSVIASLDKTGRLRFWDINDMLNDASFVEGPAPAEIRVPLTTFVTGSPTEKSWPTSVLFLDKLRALSINLHILRPQNTASTHSLNHVWNIFEGGKMVWAGGGTCDRCPSVASRGSAPYPVYISFGPSYGT
ncbi:uncharacterized protein N7479_001755 [Penicillium vulpinum]|nr:uncharacterized protein N7479_001755 [Penicillium vulpinum]KAJ5971837.1 hypothetical protein N7479_001755 [Penicillium vulpinum]